MRLLENLDVFSRLLLHGLAHKNGVANKGIFGHEKSMAFYWNQHSGGVGTTYLEDIQLPSLHAHVGVFNSQMSSLLTATSLLPYWSSTGWHLNSRSPRFTT